MIRSPRLVTLLVPVIVLGMSVPAAAQQARPTDLACPPGEVPPSGFTDTAGNTHERAIDCAADHGVTTGVTADRYGPDLPVRRDQMATFIARMLQAAGMPLPENPPHRFADVPPDGTHTFRINQLAELGVVGGFGDGTYRPAEPVRRDQMASFIARAVQEATGIGRSAEGTWFNDVAGNTHEGNINVLAAEGVVAGFGDGTYRPALDVRRDQMASFLMRALDLIFEDGAFFGEFEFAVLTGGNVVDDSGDDPAFNQGQVSGYGFALVTADQERDEVCYFAQALVASPVTAAHLHRGAMDETGPPVLTLQLDAEGSGDGCAPGGGLATEIAEQPDAFYVQVHTEELPDGAVRGQLGVEPYVSGLSWGNVVAEPDEGGFVLGQGQRDTEGLTFVQLHEPTGVACAVTLVEESASPFVGQVLRRAQMDEVGDVLATFPAPEPVEHPEIPEELEPWIGGGCSQLGSAAVGAVVQDLGGHAVEVATDSHPDGAARGQLGAVTLEVPLSWEDEVDDEGNPDQGEPGATGVAVLQMDLESGRLCYFVETDATGPFTGNHIHEGAAGENGPIVVGLAQPDDDTGVVSACQNEDPEELLSLLFEASSHYLNVHTADYPAGAVRGQLGAGFEFEGEFEESVVVEDPYEVVAQAAVALLQRD